MKKTILCFIVVLCATSVYGQENWPTPEVKQMYEHAVADRGRGNLDAAATTLRQAIKLAPDNIILYKELGGTLYQSGKYAEAEQTLNTIINTPRADALCFELMAASEERQQKVKEAKSTLQKGFSRFPSSGLLYHESGNEYNSEGKKEQAQDAWLNGIKKDPGYAENYREAAHVYLASENVLWGLLYGEMYLDMAHDSAGDEVLKQQLFTGYKTMFDRIGAAPAKKGSGDHQYTVHSFEDAVMAVYTTLTPVISDGITTENLTMVRVRFLMEWFATYAKKYPFSLFTYQDELIRSGHFDMSNQWLFGKAESATQFDAWNKFHEGDIDRFLKWKEAHQLQSVAGDFYNTRD